MGCIDVSMMDDNLKMMPPLGMSLADDAVRTPAVLHDAKTAGVAYLEIRRPDTAALLAAEPSGEWFVALKIPLDVIGDLAETVDETLAAGGLDLIDLVLIDDIGDATFPKGSTLQATMTALKENGRIRSFGVSVDTYGQLKNTLTKTSCDVVEVLFNVFFQEPSQLFSFVKAKRMPLIIKNPFDDGWLTGDVTDRTGESETQKREVLIKKMKDIVGTDDLVTRSLGFIRAFDGVTTVVVPIHAKKMLDTLSDLDPDIITYSQKNALIDLYNQQIKNQPFMRSR